MSYNKARPRAKSLIASGTVSSNMATQPTKHRDPFGPVMAQDVFDLWYYDGEDCIAEFEDSNVYYEAVKEEDLFDGELQSYHFRYQGELEIETAEELNEQLRTSARKFEQAYRKISHHALKWHWLMQDIEKNPQLKKMFGDIQLMRKLNGSEGV